MVQRRYFWYFVLMSTTSTVRVGDRGRLVLPASLRARQHWDQGETLHLIETESGVVMATREQLKRLVRDRLSGPSLVDELLDERRAAAREESSS